MINGVYVVEIHETHYVESFNLLKTAVKNVCRPIFAVLFLSQSLIAMFCTCENTFNCVICAIALSLV